MNVHADANGSILSLKASLRDQALTPYVLLGMPHLTPSGLSETWLMKELGHRHWLLLGQSLGLDDADFRTPAGEELYAAFCASSLRHARLDHPKANDVLTIRSSLDPVTRNQVLSRHQLSVEGSAIGEVELISTFVLREREDDNHSIRRSPITTKASSSPAGVQSCDLASAAARIRKGQMPDYMGLTWNGDTSLQSFSFTPVASQEFNGASLFYCAQFQAIHDRAATDWGLEHLTSSATTRRDIFFLGNLNRGESVRLDLKAIGANGNVGACLVSGMDGRPLAVIFSECA